MNVSLPVQVLRSEAAPPQQVAAKKSAHPQVLIEQLAKAIPSLDPKKVDPKLIEAMSANFSTDALATMLEMPQLLDELQRVSALFKQHAPQEEPLPPGWMPWIARKGNIFHKSTHQQFISKGDALVSKAQEVQDRFGSYETRMQRLQEDAKSVSEEFVNLQKELEPKPKPAKEFHAKLKNALVQLEKISNETTPNDRESRKLFKKFRKECDALKAYSTENYNPHEYFCHRKLQSLQGSLLNYLDKAEEYLSEKENPQACDKKRNEELTNFCNDLKVFLKSLPAPHSPEFDLSAVQHFVRPQAAEEVKPSKQPEELIDTYLRIIQDMFKESDTFIKDTKASLNTLKSMLSEMNNLVENAEDVANPLASIDLFIEMQVKSLNKVHKSLLKQQKQFVESAAIFSDRNKKSSSSFSIAKLGAMSKIYWRFLTNTKEEVKQLMRAYEQVQLYAMKHPSKEMKQLVLDMAHILDLLNDNDQVDIFIHQLQLDPITQGLFQGFSNKELPSDPNMPQEMKDLCELFHAGPIVISALKGIRSGPTVPLDQFSVVAGAFGLGPLALGLTFANMAFGAWHNVLVAKSVQDIRGALSEDQIDKLNFLMRFIKQDFATYEEVKQAEEQMRALRTGLNVADGKSPGVSLDFFTRPIKDFGLKMKKAGWKERTVRIFTQIILPTVICLGIAVGIAATVMALGPGGVAIIAAVVGIIVALAADGYISYLAISKLSSVVDKFIFPNTCKEVEEDKALKRVKDLMKEYKDVIDEAVKACRKDFEQMLEQGFYDREIEDRIRELKKDAVNKDINDAEIRKMAKTQLIADKKASIKKRVREIAENHFKNGSDKLTFEKAKAADFEMRMEKFADARLVNNIMSGVSKRDHFKIGRLFEEALDKIDDEEVKDELKQYFDSDEKKQMGIKVAHNMILAQLQR